MLHNYRIVLSNDEFGRILADNIRKSYEVEDCQTVNVHAMTEDGQEIEVFNTDDTYGLITAITEIACKFTGDLNKAHPKIKCYGLDVYETEDSEAPYLQLDIKVDSVNRKIKITDLRLPNDLFWNEFGFGRGARAFVGNHITGKGL